MTYDVVAVGVGGQGVLTLCDLIVAAATRKNIPAMYFPSKGMAQRGGSIKVSLRLGRRNLGPKIPEKGADLVISMERSETLRAIRYIKPGKDFLVCGYVRAPTGVMLGKASYPTLDQVKGHIEKAGSRMLYVDPESLPFYEGATVSPNVYVLGVAAGLTDLGEMVDPADLAIVVKERWKGAAERNAFAFGAGMEARGLK